jgi:hypothetical protein
MRAALASFVLHARIDTAFGVHSQVSLIAIAASAAPDIKASAIRIVRFIRLPSCAPVERYSIPFFSTCQIGLVHSAQSLPVKYFAAWSLPFNCQSSQATPTSPYHPAPG